MDAISDLAFFVLLMKQGSLTAVAREMGITPPAVSKRLAQLERRLGVRLLNRTTRRLSLTHEGEAYLQRGTAILHDLEALEQLVGSSRDIPKGLLRVNATFGFGRMHIAPAISAFVKRYPAIEVQLHLTDHPLNLGDSGFDIGIRIGELPDARIGARLLAVNRRVLCAAPAYLKAHGEPVSPRDLAKHQCIVIRENDTAYGTWRFNHHRDEEVIKVRGALSTNDGRVALQWALEGHGILMRSIWDVAPYLRSGRLQTLLDDWQSADANIYAVYAESAHLPAKTRAFIDFLGEYFTRQRQRKKDPLGGW